MADMSSAAAGTLVGVRWPSRNTLVVTNRPSRRSKTSTVCASGDATQTSGTPRLS